MKSRNQEPDLDELDLQILGLLQENAKQTYTEIGGKLDIAHSTVYERIQRLEEQGIIKKYEAIVDPEKMGIQQITAVMNITADPKETENIAKKLARFHEVLEVSTAFSEELIISAKVVAQDQIELHSFIAKSIAPLPGVSRIRTGIVTRKYKEERFQLSPKRVVSKK